MALSFEESKRLAEKLAATPASLEMDMDDSFAYKPVVDADDGSSDTEIVPYATVDAGFEKSGNYT